MDFFQALFQIVSFLKQSYRSFYPLYPASSPEQNFYSTPLNLLVGEGSGPLFLE